MPLPAPSTFPLIIHPPPSRLHSFGVASHASLLAQFMQAAGDVKTAQVIRYPDGRTLLKIGPSTAFATDLSGRLLGGPLRLRGQQPEGLVLQPCCPHRLYVIGEPNELQLYTAPLRPPAAPVHRPPRPPPSQAAPPQAAPPPTSPNVSHLQPLLAPDVSATETPGLGTGAETTTITAMGGAALLVALAAIVWRLWRRQRLRKVLVGHGGAAGDQTATATMKAIDLELSDAFELNDAAIEASCTAH